MEYHSRRTPQNIPSENATSSEASRNSQEINKSQGIDSSQRIKELTEYFEMLCSGKAQPRSIVTRDNQGRIRTVQHVIEIRDD